MKATSLRFDVTPTRSATELRLHDHADVLPVSAWALAGHAGADLVQRLVLEDQAIEEGDVVLVEHSAIARLTAEEARRLGLPPATALRAVVEGNGIMLRPDFAATLRWVRADRSAAYRRHTHRRMAARGGRMAPTARNLIRGGRSRRRMRCFGMR